MPVPEVFDVDGPDIVMEKVDGPTMLADLARRPWRLASHAATLARLHERVHAVPAIDGAGHRSARAESCCTWTCTPTTCCCRPGDRC